MANDIKWLKLMNDMFEDDKIEYIESLPDGDTVLVIWVKVLCLASKCNNDGYLMVTSEIPYTPPLLANKFKKPATQVNYALSVMQKLGMIDIFDDLIQVSNWCKYQSVDELARIREQTRQRVIKCREKKKLLCNATSNATETKNCNDFALISNSNNNYDILDYKELLEIVKEESYAIYLRHSKQVDEKGNMQLVRQVTALLEDLQGQYNYEQLREVFRHANKTYIVSPQYNTLDIAWVLKNIRKVMETEESDTPNEGGSGEDKPKGFWDEKLNKLGRKD